MKSSCNVVDQVGDMKIEGNLVPHLWYKNITFSSGKANFVAITLLADILYWYRPTFVRDESGNVVGTRTKFKGDMLQKSYQAFADTYGFTKRQVKEGIDFLVDHHLLIREFRTITTSSIVLSNVMYVQPVAENVRRVIGERCHVSELVSICRDDTLERTTACDAKEDLSQEVEGSPPVERETYTERSSESSSEIKSNQQQQSARECAVTFFKENGFGRMGSYLEEKIQGWCEKLSSCLVVEAMKKAAEQGKQYWSYVEAILMKWELKDVRDDAEAKELEIMSKKGSKGKKRTGQKTKPIRTEKLPEWFTQETSEEAAVQEQDEEFEVEKAKLMAELEEYRERVSQVVMQG